MKEKACSNHSTLLFKKYYEYKNRLELLVNDPVLLGQSVDAVIGLSHPPDGAADGVGLEVGGHAASGLVNLGEVELDACVVLGGKNTVAGGTFPENIRVTEMSGENVLNVVEIGRDLIEPKLSRLPRITEYPSTYFIQGRIAI